MATFIFEEVISVKSSITRFLKKYGYYVVGFMLLAAIGMTTYMTTTNKQSQGEGIIDVGANPITFRMPMNSLTVLKEYSEDHIFNQTLDQWSTHRAYSLTSADLKVYAVAQGVVEETGHTFELGNYIVIDHGNGIKSFYASLDKDLLVSKGTNVEKGQTIANASDTAENYSLDGKHLFFRMYESSNIVNPEKYLVFSNK